MSTKRRGFAVREAASLVVLSVLSAATLAPMAAQGGGQSRIQVCMSRMKYTYDVAEMFSNEHADAIPSLQSRSGTVVWKSLGARTYSADSSGEQQCVRDQAIDIIRRRGARPDMNRSFAPWLPAPFYNHLVLSEYLDESLPAERLACPEDASLLAWQSDPANFNNLGVPSPVAPGDLGNDDKRWPYISSYSWTTYAWGNDSPANNAGYWQYGGVRTYVRSGGYTPGHGDIGWRRRSEVAFPSAKVELWDRGSRHFTPRAVFWGFPQTKQPVLFFDGVVRTTRTGAAGRPDRFSYSFDFTTADARWLPGRPDGDASVPSVFASAYLAITENGLRGRDLP